MSGAMIKARRVSSSAVSGKVVTVEYATVDPSSLIATAGSDYTAVPVTTLTFAAGKTSKQVTVLVNGDTQVEGTERFVVKLSNASNATIVDSEGFGTIQNDDAATLLFGSES